MATNATIVFADGTSFAFDANALPVGTFHQRYTRNNVKHKLLRGGDFTQLLGIGAAELTLTGKYFPAQIPDPFVVLRDVMLHAPEPLVTVYVNGTGYSGYVMLSFESTGLEFFGDRAQAVEWTLKLRQQGAFRPSQITDLPFATPDPELIVLEIPSGLRLDWNGTDNVLSWSTVSQATDYRVSFIDADGREVYHEFPTEASFAVPRGFRWLALSLSATVTAQSSQQNIISSDPSDPLVGVFAARVSRVQMNNGGSGKVQLIGSPFDGHDELLGLADGSFTGTLLANNATYNVVGKPSTHALGLEIDVTGLPNGAGLIGASLVYRIGTAAIIHVVGVVP